MGFLMFGNLLRECGVLGNLSDTAQNGLANLITLLLGITISFSMRADAFVRVDTLMIMGIGLIAFVFDTIGGVLFAKILNLFRKEKINPMIGAAGISAFPMSARVVQKIPERGAGKYYPDARSRRQCIRPDRFSYSRRPCHQPGDKILIGGNTMMENFLIALEIMGKGMGGIFVSILIIMGCVVIMGKILK